MINYVKMLFSTAKFDILQDVKNTKQGGFS